MKALHRTLIAAAVAACSLSAQAALQSRDGGMVYDTATNLTWLADWNSPAGTLYDTDPPGAGNTATDGQLRWVDANNWANDLSFGGFEDWRLPTAVRCTAAATSCTAAGEMATLWTNNANASTFFSNVKSTGSLAYWTGTYGTLYTNAWDFRMGPDPDVQVLAVANAPNHYAVAVRFGDVAPVPEPETYAMMLLGLGTLAVASARRRRHLGGR